MFDEQAAGGLGSIAVESTTSSAWWIFEQMGEAMYSAYSSVVSLFSTAETADVGPAVQQEGWSEDAGDRGC